METSVRGFSFMSETKVEVADLQYIEGGELERTWKSSRRQRVKEQEQKVWEEFVKEQDVVQVICKDDPYQFLHDLPESCLKEMMETELQKARKEVEQEINADQPNQGEGDFNQKDEVQHAVTFADEEREDCDMFHIFDDEKDDPSGPSGPEDEAIYDSAMGSPCTVRERDSENNSPVPLHEKGDNKSSENMSNVIQSSIYCAKVKDLRLKINDEILAIVASLERQGAVAAPAERAQVSRLCRRSAEFSARFNRIHMYQLRLQMQDVKRNTLHSTPFAKHTHFHAQMLRVASLHQNLLQAFQVFHKSVEQTACVRESCAMLHSLALVARDASALSAAVPAPPALRAAALIYDDEMLASCDKLDEAVCEHSLRVSDFLSTTDNTSRSPSRRCKGKGKRKMRGLSTKSTKSIPDAEARLSMYSLDTQRQLTCSTSKDIQSSTGTSKFRGPLSNIASKPQNNSETQPKSPKKSPRSRRPLMRGGRAVPRARAHKDSEITTMVEAVEMCTSSHMSREPSPGPAPAPASAASPRKSITSTPRQRLRQLSPKAKFRRGSPKQSQIMKALSSIKSDPLDSETVPIQITPISKIQCAKKDMNVGKNFDKLDLNLDKSNKILDKDRNADKTSTLDSGKDFDSVGNMDSKGLDSVKDFDSFKDFDSGRGFKDSDSGKDFDCRKEFNSGTATSSRERKEVNVKVADSSGITTREERDGSRSDRERNKTASMAPARCEVTRLLKQLCSGDASGSKKERVSGAKNAQLLCVSGGSPRQPSTPQLLRILEETIQKKAPKPMYTKPTARDPDRFRMTFNIPDETAESLFQYRTKFVQHMLASSMYANSAVGKPWEMIGSVSEKIIDDLLTGCVKEMQIKEVIQDLYNCETK